MFDGEFLVYTPLKCLLYYLVIIIQFSPLLVGLLIVKLCCFTFRVRYIVGFSSDKGFSCVGYDHDNGMEIFVF